MELWVLRRHLKWRTLLQIEKPESTSRSIRVGCRKTAVLNATESEWSQEVSTNNLTDVIGRGAAVFANSQINCYSSERDIAAGIHWRVLELVVCSSKTMCKVTSVSTMSPTTLSWTFSRPRRLPNPPCPCRASERSDWTTTPSSMTSIAYINFFNGFYCMKTWSASVGTYYPYYVFAWILYSFTIILQNWERPPGSIFFLFYFPVQPTSEETVWPILLLVVYYNNNFF